MHQVEARATAKYRGVHFGLLREKRSEFRGRDGPGPGLYSPKPSSDVTTMTSKVRMYVCIYVSTGAHTPLSAIYVRS